MKTFAAKEKPSVPAVRKARPYIHHPMGPVLQKQQTEIRRILRSTGAQAKLSIGKPNDKYEQEADRVADEVMRMPDPNLQRQSDKEEEEEEAIQAKPLADQITPLVQRQEEPPEEEEESAQAKSMPGQSPEVSNEVESSINNLLGGGQPLSNSIRDYMEPRFGHDFGQVRVHTDSRASASARTVKARAYTVGQNVVFGTGQYAPGTRGGKRLLAHELTHVKQQGQSNKTHGIGDVVHRQSTDIAAAPTTDTAIENLDLATKAKAAAYALKAKHPTITFSSGRRSKNDQARAMASNVVLNRNWIKETYSNTTARRKCQQWVDNHPTATTKLAIQTGLKTVLDSLTDAQLGALSKHLSGEAFDVQPVTENAAAIKADIRALSGIKKFLESEGGLTRWHAQF